MLEDVTIMDDLVTTNYLCVLFKRSVLTLAHWRKSEGLPYIRLKSEGRDAIRYSEVAVLKWAKKHRKYVHEVEAEA